MYAERIVPWLGNVSVKGKFLVIASFLFLSNISDFNRFPSFTHAQAQADRYALATGFVDNGLNLWHPQTYVYNKQFPHNHYFPHEGRITSVDFPLPEYLVAIIMTITGSKSILIFRLFMLALTSLAFAYLWKNLSKWLSSDMFAGLIVLLLLSSPLIVYYSVSFIPSIFSFALFSFGAVKYFQDETSHSTKSYWATVTFFLLAALVRTPFLIPIIGLIGVELLSWVIFRRLKLKPILILIAAFLIATAYFLYNLKLRHMHGSVFLGSPAPSESWAELMSVIKASWQNFGTHYSTLSGYVLSFGFLLIACFHAFKKKKCMPLESKPFQFVVITGTGFVIYALLMARQFVNHDYYFIDSFLPALFLLIVYLISRAHFRKLPSYWYTWAILLIALVTSLLEAYPVVKQKKPIDYWNYTYQTVDNFKGSDVFLDSLGVSRKDKILVLDAMTSNIPFSLMDRPGYALIHLEKDHIMDALEWDYEYIIAQDQFFKDRIGRKIPDITHMLKRIAGNNRISVLKLKSTFDFGSFDEYYRVNDTNMIFAIRTADLAREFSSTYTDTLIVDQEYKFNKIIATDSFDSNLRLIKLSLEAKGELVADSPFIVVELKSGKERVLYKPCSLKENMTIMESGWNRFVDYIPVNLLGGNAPYVSIYFWNPSETEVMVRSLKYEFYK